MPQHQNGFPLRVFFSRSVNLRYLRVQHVSAQCSLRLKPPKLLSNDGFLRLVNIQHVHNTVRHWNGFSLLSCVAPCHNVLLIKLLISKQVLVTRSLPVQLNRARYQGCQNQLWDQIQWIRIAWTIQGASNVDVLARWHAARRGGNTDEHAHLVPDHKTRKN